MSRTVWNRVKRKLGIITGFSVLCTNFIEFVVGTPYNTSLIFLIDRNGYDGDVAYTVNESFPSGLSIDQVQPINNENGVAIGIIVVINYDGAATSGFYPVTINVSGGGINRETFGAVSIN